MLGDTVSITVNAVAKTLAKINQDGYSSEYYLRETTQEFRLKVRHSKDRPTSKGIQVDRHNVELTWTLYPDANGLGGKTRRTYAVITNEFSDDATQLGHLQSALNGFMTASNVAKFANWES